MLGREDYRGDKDDGPEKIFGEMRVRRGGCCEREKFGEERVIRGGYWEDKD